MTFLVWNPNGTLVHNDTGQVQNLNPGQTKEMFTKYDVPNDAPLGTYRAEARLFDQVLTYDIKRTTFQVT